MRSLTSFPYIMFSFTFAWVMCSRGQLYAFLFVLSHRYQGLSQGVRRASLASACAAELLLTLTLCFQVPAIWSICQYLYLLPNNTSLCAVRFPWVNTSSLSLWAFWVMLLCAPVCGSSWEWASSFLLFPVDLGLKLLNHISAPNLTF